MIKACNIEFYKDSLKLTQPIKNTFSSEEGSTPYKEEALYIYTITIVTKGSSLGNFNPFSTNTKFTPLVGVLDNYRDNSSVSLYSLEILYISLLEYL